MRDKELTRERILEAAEKLFAEKGFHETAMDEIVRTAKVSKGGVYFHFPSKEELFFALLDKLADALQHDQRGGDGPAAGPCEQGHDG
ncbi:MAG: TetR/AcrR family transcriptional regulator, partial [Candidatus Bipolaricaulota bacterium]|nr:TetR/AcrR family transcriptional regulator [Candidatus Bipolaricaulota bacterium]